jgi:hypothetical protein
MPRIIGLVANTVKLTVKVAKPVVKVLWYMWGVAAWAASSK